MDFLSINKVEYSYPGKKERAVDSVSLRFAYNEKVAITGNNGSGKSTLIKLMVNILRPEKGDVLLEGRSTGKYTLGEIGAKIGLLLQNPSRMLFCPSVYDEVTFALKWHGFNREECYARAREHLEYFKLWSYRDRHPFTLSGGEQQLLAIAAVTVLKPLYLILDEPTNGLDSYRISMLERFLAELYGQGMGIMVASHHAGFLDRFGGRKIKMAAGRVASGEA